MALQSAPWDGRRSVLLLGHGREHEDNGVALSLAWDPTLHPLVSHTLCIGHELWGAWRGRPVASMANCPKAPRKANAPSGDFYGTTKAWFPLALSHEGIFLLLLRCDISFNVQELDESETCTQLSDFLEIAQQVQKLFQERWKEVVTILSSFF